MSDANMDKRAGGGGAVNRHPAVMFEIIARNQGRLKKFYGAVFGWTYEVGSGNFAYIRFPQERVPLLGGIGEAMDEPGFAPGCNFYLLVDDLEATIEKARSNGGEQLMEPTSFDIYHIAMIQDPEGNSIGLIKPFSR